MKLRVALLAPSLLFATGPARAAPPVQPELELSHAQFEALAHFGVTTAPFDVTTLREAKGHAFLLLAGARYALSSRLALELRAPLVLGSVAQPAGSYVDASAWGNPQLGARYRLVQRVSADASLTLSTMLEIGAPVASHADDLQPNRLLAIADAIEGRGNPERFTPGVLPLTPSAALRYIAGKWSVDSELRFPVLVRLSDADLPRAGADTKPLGLATVLGVEGRYRLSHRFSVAAAAHLALDVAPAVARLPQRWRVQDFERLSLHVHFGASSSLVVDLQTAVAGDLGGNTVGGGLRFGANL